jgi:hypothetical protein
VQGSHSIVAIYKFAPPSGAWSPEDNGAYTIRVRDGKVKDINGAATSARPLAAFQVSV